MASPATLVQILTIGDEILHGHIQDSNKGWLTEEVGLLGFSVIHHATVADDKQAILQALKEAEQRADIIIITGGLGPTSDDYTRATLAAHCGVELIRDHEALAHLQKMASRRNRILTEHHYQQADIPKGAQQLKNLVGTAQGLWVQKNQKAFIALPGVPFEMKEMAKNELFPLLIKKYSPRRIIHRTLCTIGCGESELANKIQDWEKNLDSCLKLAYLPGKGQVKLRLTAIESCSENVEQKVIKALEDLKSYIGDYVYSENNQTLSEVVAQKLTQLGATVSVAESCTGGFLGHLITQVPGASRYFMGGIVAYDNQVKQSLLGVSANILKAEGAVSEKVVKQMAEGVRERLGTTFGLAVSGVMGPGGGTLEKPVGTLWVAVAAQGYTSAKCFMIGNQRLHNIEWAANLAINQLRITLSSFKTGAQE